MLHSGPTLLVFKPLIPLCPFCIFSLCPLLYLPVTPARFFNGMLAIFEQGSLNCFTFFCPILLILSVSRNQILTYLPLSGSLDFLLCVLIAPTPGLAFFFVMPRTLASSLFSSGKAYFSLNFLPPLFLRLTPTLIMYGSTFLQETLPGSHSLMCPLSLFVLLQRIAEPNPFIPSFFPS